MADTPSIHRPSRDIAGERPAHVSPRNLASRVTVGFRFFTRRGNLDLTRDSSAHRRYAFLYEDMMN